MRRLLVLVALLCDDERGVGRLSNGTKITVTASLDGHLTTTVVDRVKRARRVEGRPVCEPVGC